MSTVLLLIVGLVAPWTVHLAPPRQRLLALVGVVAVLLLYLIFAENPLARWELWAGLAAGVLSVLLLAGRGRRDGPRPPRRAAPLEDVGGQPTGEL